MGTVDGTYSDWTEDAANNVIPGTLTLAYSSAGSDILDTFDAQINAVTTPAGEGQGQASTSGSDSGILNQVNGHVKRRTDTGAWVTDQSYTDTIYHVGYYWTNYLNENHQVSITHWVPIISATSGPSSPSVPTPPRTTPPGGLERPWWEGTKTFLSVAGSRIGNAAYYGSWGVLTGETQRLLVDRGIAVTQQATGHEFNGSFNDYLTLGRAIAGEILPFNSAVESYYGHDLGTGEELDEWERAERGLSAFGQTILTVTPVKVQTGLISKAINKVPGATKVISKVKPAMATIATKAENLVARVTNGKEVFGYGQKVLNIVIKESDGLANKVVTGFTTRKEAALIRRHLLETTETKIIYGSKRAKRGNFYDPQANEIHLQSGSRNQPRGMFYEEVQHAIDRSTVADKIKLGNDRLHTGTFQRMASNPLFNLLPHERSGLLNLADYLWTRNWR